MKQQNLLFLAFTDLQTNEENRSILIGVVPGFDSYPYSIGRIVTMKVPVLNDKLKGKYRYGLG